jgi:hypothetical protein
MKNKEKLITDLWEATRQAYEIAVIYVKAAYELQAELAAYELRNELQDELKDENEASQAQARITGEKWIQLAKDLEAKVKQLEKEQLEEEQTDDKNS